MAKAELDLDINLDGADKGLKKLGDKAEKAGKESGKKFGSGFSLGAKVAIGAALGVVAFKKLSNAIGSLVEASSRQQDAVNALNSAMKINGDFTEQASKDLQNFASNLQSVSTIGDEATLEMLAFTKSLGLTDDMSKKVVEASANMAAALGIDYKTAVQETAKSLTGMRGRVASMIPALKNLTTEQLKAGEGVRIMQEQFGGAAQAKLNTYSGAIQALENTYGDFLEKLGDTITSSPAVVKAINLVKTTIEGLSNSLGNAGKTDVVGVLIKNFAVFGMAVNDYLIKPFIALKDIAAIVFQGIVFAVDAVIASFAQLGGTIGEVLNFVGIENSLTEGLKNFAASSTEVAGEAFGGLAETITNSFDFSSTDKLDDFLNKLEQIGNTTQASVSKASVAMKKMSTVTKTEGNKINIDLKKTLVDGIASSMVSLTSALVNGGNAFQAFSATVLGIVGDMMINVGKSILMTALGIDALKKSFATFFGGFGIAAGLALIALGGLMKGASSSMASAASGATAAAVGAGSSAGGAPTVALEPEAVAPTEAEDLEERGTQTAITLNVQGDILDAESTSLRIVDLLNQAYEGQGATINGGMVVA